MKIAGGITGLTLNQTALDRFVLTAPQISQVVEDFFENNGITKASSRKHHQLTGSVGLCHHYFVFILSIDGVDNPTYNPQRCYNVPADEFRAFVEGIWDADTPYRVIPSPNNQDMTTHFQPKLAYQTQMSRFFSQPIDNQEFNNIIYQAFAPLVADDLVDDHLGHSFISAIIASDVGQRAIQLMPHMTEQNFRTGLSLLLFGDNWHIFNHVFRGEKKMPGKKITGYHNWYKFYTQERDNLIKYLGSGDANLVHLLEARNERHYFMGGFKTAAPPPIFKKAFGTFFIGTSPAFEAVLYYYVHVHGCWGVPFFLRPGLQDRTCIAGFYDNQWGAHPPTCFPVVETEQNSCENHKLQMIGPFPQLMTTTTTTPHPPSPTSSTTTVNPPEPPSEDGTGTYLQLIYKSIESFLERTKLFTSDVLRKLAQPMEKFKEMIHTEDDVNSPEDGDKSGGKRNLLKRAPPSKERRT